MIIQVQAASGKVPANSPSKGLLLGVQSLESFTELARVPVVIGVSGRVVDALQRRLGHSSLAIEQVARDLNLSKRTLQRRLQQQDCNFAQLRDQIRFHHAINYLIVRNMTIEAVSLALDFSDRTSFTNAFKRWTEMSPSAFRKMYRPSNS